MNTTEIKNRVDEINAKLCDHALTFPLNDEMVKLIDELEELQAQCEHEFENGVCIYCGAIE